jgi:hypothetical protein
MHNVGWAAGNYLSTEIDNFKLAAERVGLAEETQAASEQQFVTTLERPGIGILLNSAREAVLEAWGGAAIALKSFIL